MKYLLVFVTSLLFLLVLPTSTLASTLSLDPSSGTYNRSCPFSLNVKLDTAGADIYGTDAYILYDNSRFTATLLTQGTIFSEYSGSNIDDASGKVSISGLASVSKGFTGQGVLATINFTVKENAPAGATQIKFDYDPSCKSASAQCCQGGINTCDSNAVLGSTVQETLTAVTNGNYTIGTGSCTSASPGPGAGVAAGKGGITAGQGTPGATATPSAQQKQLKEFKTVDQIAGGSPGGGNELTAALVIVGSVLTILGILGLALL